MPHGRGGPPLQPHLARICYRVGESFGPTSKMFCDLQNDGLELQIVETRFDSMPNEVSDILERKFNLL